MLRRAAFAFLNHLLHAEPWAATRLKPFAGQHARFELGALRASFVVAGDGSLVAAGDDGGDAAVVITLPGDAPFRLISDRKALLAGARITGTADFAEALGFVARNLRWDAEADLAKGIGDIAAHRLLAAGRQFKDGGRDRYRRLQANITESVGDGTTLVVARSEADALADELSRLLESVDRLAGRIDRL